MAPGENETLNIHRFPVYGDRELDFVVIEAGIRFEIQTAHAYVYGGGVRVQADS